MYCQLHISTVSLHVPGWVGFILETGQVPKRLTTIDYYPFINHPITNYSTVQECHKVSKNTLCEVGQKYTVATFDLDHIVLIESFHLICAYLK